MGLMKNNSAGGVPSFSDFNGGFQQGQKAANTLISSGERGYDRHRKNQALDAMGKAWASGDPSQLDAAMAAFPEYIGQMQKQMGIRDDQHRKDLGSMTARLHGLLNAGDTEGAKALVQQNAGLFDKEGPYSAQGVSGLIDSGDEKQLKRLDNWAQSTTLGSLTPLEIIKEGDAQQRFGIDRQRLAQSYDLGQRRIGLGYDRLSHQDQWREQAHEDRMAGIASRLGSNDIQELVTPDGQTHRIPLNPKTGKYANHDTKGNPIDENGRVINLTGNAGLQSGAADALRALDSASKLAGDEDFKGMGGNNIAARKYRETDPTGKYHDLQAKFDSVNKAVAAAIAVRLTQESGGFAPKQGEIEAGIKSAGELSSNNSYDENKAILKRQQAILRNVYESAKRNEDTGNTGSADIQHQSSIPAGKNHASLWGG